MSKLSLRWRITILMGALVMLVCVLLTGLSIHNATNNFVLPLSVLSVQNGESAEKAPDLLTFDGNISDLPPGTHYIPEISLDVKNARQSFSVASFLYMLLVAALSMIITYYLAGRAMRPISKLNREIEQIDGSTLSKRVSTPQTKDEIESLSLSFNKLLERLEQEFEREKQFSSNVAHELKTPLATIMTSAEVLKLNEQTTPQEYQENLEITLQSAKRLSKVVEGLLMLCRTNHEISFELVDISRMLGEIQREIEPVYSSKNITVKYELNAATINANPLLIYRAFFNLIENSFKYTQPHGIISISSRCENDELLICIEDNGIGIPAQDIAHIFEPFYRSDKSRSRKTAGAGLGLSITKEILDLHDAKIAISSDNGNKTKAQLRFKC